MKAPSTPLVLTKDEKKFVLDPKNLSQLKAIYHMPRDENGNTWLHYLAGDKDIPPMTLYTLLSYSQKHDPNARPLHSSNNAGHTPFDYFLAFNKSQEEGYFVTMLGYFKKFGAKTDDIDQAGNTFLHTIVKAGIVPSSAMLTALQHYGVDFTQRNHQGQRPVDIAPPENAEALWHALHPLLPQGLEKQKYYALSPAEWSSLEEKVSSLNNKTYITTLQGMQEAIEAKGGLSIIAKRFLPKLSATSEEISTSLKLLPRQQQITEELGKQLDRYWEQKDKKEHGQATQTQQKLETTWEKLFPKATPPQRQEKRSSFRAISPEPRRPEKPNNFRAMSPEPQRPEKRSNSFKDIFKRRSSIKIEPESMNVETLIQKANEALNLLPAQVSKEDRIHCLTCLAQASYVAMTETPTNRRDSSLSAAPSSPIASRR